jgi:iron-sulfur cluster insertion protein|tara:strand:+ start:845 stop:1165 length:321 start_codon:yes stop_codon:yes gene_type:complete
MTLEPTAVKKLSQILAEENNPNLKLRVFVQGGGCSGFQYGFTLDEAANEDDFDLEFDGVRVLVDSGSWQYLHEAKIDFHDGLDGSNFVIENPQAKSTCGCGSSFST